MKYPEPFASRHPAAIGEAIGLGVLRSARQQRMKHRTFIENILNYALVSGHLSDSFRDLAVDVAVSSNNYKAIVTLTSKLDKLSYYVYRAYAFYKLNAISQLNSLVRQFHQIVMENKAPENLLVYATLECLEALSKHNWTKLEESLIVLSFLQKEHKEMNKHFFMLLVNLIMAEAYVAIEQFDKAEEKVLWVHNNAQGKKDTYYQLKALLLLANINTLKGDWQKAQRILSQAIPLAEEVGEQKELFVASAKLELKTGNFERTLSLLKQALNYTGDNFQEYVNVISQIVEVCLLTGNLNEARQYLKSAIEINQKYMLNMLEPYLYTAWVAIENNELHDAFVLLNFCREELEKRPDQQLKVKLLYLLGIYEYKSKLYDVAIDDFKEANKLAQETKNYEYMIKTQIEIANVSLEKFAQTRELSDFSYALQAIEDLQFLAVEQKIPKLICGVNLLQGYLFLLAEKLDPAKHPLNEAIELARRHRFTKELEQAQTLLRYINLLESKTEKPSEHELKKIAESIPLLKEYFVISDITPKEQTTLYGIAVVETDTGIMKYKYQTEYDKNNVTALIPTTVAAVNIYANTVLDNALNLTHIREEGYEMLIENLSEKFIAVAIVDQTTYNFKQQFVNFTKKLKENLHIFQYYDYEQASEEVNQYVKEFLDQFVKKSAKEEE